MNNTAKKLIEIYSNLNALSESKISKIFHFVEQVKTENEQAKPKCIGQLAGLCKVSLPDNLKNEIRRAREEISSSIMSKKI